MCHVAPTLTYLYSYLFLFQSNPVHKVRRFNTPGAALDGKAGKRGVCYAERAEGNGRGLPGVSKEAGLGQIAIERYRRLYGTGSVECQQRERVATGTCAIDREREGGEAGGVKSIVVEVEAAPGGGVGYLS